MNKISGIFEKFTSLYNIPPQDISRWLTLKGDETLVGNSMGNRLLYPQTVSVNKSDFEVDIAILREVIKRQPEVIYNASTKRLILTTGLINRFPPLFNLIIIILESVIIKGVTAIYCCGPEKNSIVGTLVKPEKIEPNTIVALNGKVIKNNFGAVTVLPAPNKPAKLKIDSLPEISVIGGEIGIVLDFRS